MELQQFKYFKTVASIGKISEAAETLFISPPALSTSIARLEKELGVKLFDRSSNRITLNPQGQIFLKYVNQVFANLESTKQELHQSLLRQNPHISLLSINSLMWVNLIASFTSEFPQYTLSCSTTSFSDLLENGFPPQYNFFLAYDCEIPPAYTDKFHSLFLFHASPTVMIHKSHPLAEKAKLSIPELMDQRLFLSTPSSSLHQRIKQLFALYELPFPSDNFLSHHVRQKMVAENQGISFFSLHPGAVMHPNIRYIPLEDPFAPWDARIYWRKDRTLTDHEAAFRDFAQHFYRDMHKV